MQKSSIILSIELACGENVVENTNIFPIDVKMPNILTQKRKQSKVSKL